MQEKKENASNVKKAVEFAKMLMLKTAALNAKTNFIFIEGNVIPA